MRCEEILLKAHYMVEAEGIEPYELHVNECYEWKISYDIASALCKKLSKSREPDHELYTLYGIPVNIIYEKTNTIELWKKVGG